MYPVNTEVSEIKSLWASVPRRPPWLIGSREVHHGEILVADVSVSPTDVSIGAMRRAKRAH